LKPRLIIILLLIVILPLAILGWLGVRIVGNEREIVRHRFRDVLEGSLREVDSRISQLLAERQRELYSEQGLPELSHEALRERVRRSGLVRQYFVLDGDGDLVFPPLSGPLTEAENAFIDRTRQIWLNRAIPSTGQEGDYRGVQAVSQALGRGAQVQQAPATQAAPAKGKQVGKGVTLDRGWHVWYWGNGINLIYWWRDDTGAIVGAELDRARLMMDIVDRLPETNPFEPTLPNARIALVNSTGTVLYQWGGYEPAEGETSQASVTVSPPLSAWRLEYFAPSDLVGTGFGRGVLFNVLSGLGVLAVAMVAMAVYFYRESAREMREAAQRVSFVNQVSHELKTPLTSIRMYAEMLESQLEGAVEKPRKYLDVIVSESQRLSRLIGNVLTFSRKQRSALKLHRALGDVDDVLREVLEHFDAALLARGIEIEFSGGANQPAEFDRDALEQIVGNLLSNVEKYAAGADRVEVVSVQESDMVTITVTDNGPGIPPREQRRIFEPFHRVSNKLTDGVAGTGIGLAIARDLARLHGGALTLESSGQGACFKLVLHAPQRRSTEESK
jgi:signal transduction histidine kinase